MCAGDVGGFPHDGADVLFSMDVTLAYALGGDGVTMNLDGERLALTNESTSSRTAIRT